MVPRMQVLFTAVFIAVSMAGQAQVTPRPQDWETEARRKIEYLKQKNGPGTNLELQKRLLKMDEEDQAPRLEMIKTPEKANEIQQRQDEVDRILTAELKEIVKKYGWPTIRLVGIQASQSAALILNHSADHDFQRQWIPQLTRLVEQDEVVGSDLALIIDKFLVAEGKPQLYGNVFRFDGDFMVQAPVQDPEHLEQRRAQYLLPPMSVYIKTIQDFYHKKLK